MSPSKRPAVKAHGFCIMPFGLCLLVPGIVAQGQTVKPYLRIETGGHAGQVNRIAVDAAQRFLVSASNDKTARVWDLNSGKLLKILRPPIGDGLDGALFAVAVSPDGTSVAIGGYTGAPGTDAPIYIFDRESGEIRQTIARLPDVTFHLAYSQDGRYLCSTSQRRRVASALFPRTSRWMES
jgi:WD40 repeat protein